ncbi:MAG: Holliday junction branch migration protein RuvA, partial [Cohaesibacteraceae bacterium]|nr:Holliday junction branch migration protein RuvA [Cohaesibacteraceae bacterium]
LDPGVTNLQTDLGAQNAPRAIADAVSALTNLGYGQSHASSAAATVLSREGEDLPMEKLIRLSLKELSS